MNLFKRGTVLTTVSPQSVTEVTLATQTNYNLGVSVLQGNNSLRYTAQQFTSAETGSLVSVDLKLDNPGSAITGDMIIAIQADNAGNPSGTDLASVTIDVSTLSTASDPDPETFTFDSPASVTSSSLYWIVFRPDFTNSVFQFISSRAQNPSTISELFKTTTNAGAGWNASNADIYFIVNGTT